MRGHVARMDGVQWRPPVNMLMEFVDELGG